MSPQRFSEQLQGEIPYSLMHVPVSDMREGLRIHQSFLVKQKAQRSTRSGDPYLEVLLADRTGTIPARAWADATKRFASEFEEGEFVFVEGRTETYRGSLQMIIETIRRLPAHEKDAGSLPGFDPSLLVAASAHDIDEMWEELLGLARTIEPQPLRELTVGLLETHAKDFRRFPAAVSNHHAYLGGLLEHTLEVAQATADLLSRPLGSRLHRGLTLAGAILHDIGKLVELENPIAPTYGFSGQLIGHLLLGRDMVREAAAKLQWPDPRLPELLEHMIVSHHGELEYAAAMVPKTPEAIVVYYMDNISAKINTICGHIDTDPTDGDFTDWERTLSRRFFKGNLNNA